MIVPERKFKCLMIMILSVTAQLAFSRNLIHWEDDQGNAHYSDHIPPRYIKHKREKLSKQGRILEVTQAEKTKEQRELDKRLEALKKELGRIIAEQNTRDRILLNAFQSVDDIIDRQNNKLSAISASQNVTEGNIKRLTRQLELQHREAAAHERNGQIIPEKLLLAIESTSKQIAASQLEINQFFEKKLVTQKKFETDIERFNYLTHSRNSTANARNKAINIGVAEKLGLYICASEIQCYSAWKAAKIFVAQNSTTAIEIDTENLILSRAPLINSDMSLSVAKIRTADELPKIFLDIRCRTLSVNDLLCDIDKIQQYRSSFIKYMQSTMEKES